MQKQVSMELLHAMARLMNIATECTDKLQSEHGENDRTSLFYSRAVEFEELLKREVGPLAYRVYYNKTVGISEPAQPAERGRKGMVPAQARW